MRNRTRISGAWHVGAAALIAAAGTAVGSDDGPTADRSRIDNDKIREFETRAAAGAVHTNQAIPMPANRARLSRVTVLNGSERTTGRLADLSVIDGDPATAVPLDVRGQSAIELSFIGAPRWISNIDIDTDAESVAVEYLDVHRKWRPFAAGPGGEPLSGELVKAMGLRVVPVSGPRGAESAQIREVNAWMQQVDGDDGTVYGLSSAVAGEYFYEWCETYASSPLSVCSEECEGLRNELPNDWSKKGFGNSSSWESDFKRSSLGGSENSYVDANDLSYFAGHGSASFDSFWNRTSRNLLFSRTDRDDSAHVPGDSYDSWGDLDMEWMCFAACQLMRDEGYWAASMDGQHLILGWHTNMRDVTMGIDFGKHAVDSGIFDSAHTVLSSWLYAAEKNHGSGYTAKVVGENSAMGNDYLWGEGFVNPDPVDDTSYSLWTYSTGPGGLIDPAVGDRLANIRLMDQSPEAGTTDPMVVFEDKSPSAVKITVPQRLLNRERGAAAMKVYKLSVPDVQAEYVASIVEQICKETGLFCQADIGPSEDKSQYIANDGPWELRVDADTGAIQLVDTTQFGVPADGVPKLPSLGQAAEQAMANLSKIGLLPQDAQLVAVDSLVQGLGDEPKEGGGPAPVLAEPVPILQRVLFGRVIDGFGVAGPRGEMAAHIGENGLAQVQLHGWNPAEAVAETETIPLEQVLSDLSKDPTKVAIDGITLVPEKIEVVDARMGYFPSANGLLRPAYLLSCIVTERTGPNADPQASVLEINAWADTEVPVVQIANGPECADYGKDVCLDADVFGGTPPFVFEWSDDVAGPIGTSTNKVCYLPQPVVDAPDDGKDQLNAPSPHETEETTRTVTLRVTDAMGTVATDSFTFLICTTPCPADLNGDGILDLGDIQAFIALFLKGDLLADLNGDGILDQGDIQSFIALFLAGC